MSLPINIESLLTGKVVEWERLEFKEGWNPENVLHTICAFANDINNWGGGYIVLGIKAQDGIPGIPPKGLVHSQLDKIQGELIEICYKIQPIFLPIIQPYEIQGRVILIIWVPAGDARPYSAPSTQGEQFRRQYYIRSGSRSIVAIGENLRRLMELTAKIPFDDRINQQAQLKDLDLGLIREFLKEVGSDLFEESVKMSFENLCRQINIARGPSEFLRPVNAGMMFFNEQPERFFQRSQIEVVLHKDDSGTNFIEKIFKGPLHKQLRNAINFINNEVVREEVRKVEGQAEALRYYNFPYEAIEESLANAIYHKGYDLGAPIEVQIFPDKIEILSYPGPMPPLDDTALKLKRVTARDYRNRRIGDFLKELNLTEGRGTGFPKIYKSMERNGSPAPEFQTDKDLVAFLLTLRVHPEFNLKLPLSIKKDEQDPLVETDNTVVKTEDTVVKTEDTVVKTEDTVVKTEDTVVKTEDTVVKTEDTVVKTENTVVKTENTVVKTEVEKDKTTGHKIIEHIKNNNKITREELAKKIGLSVRGVEYQLNKLKQNAKIKRIGSDKGGYWQVIE